MAELTREERALARKHYAMGVDEVLGPVKQIVQNRKRFKSCEDDVFAALESIIELWEPEADWRGMTE